MGTDKLIRDNEAAAEFYLALQSVYEVRLPEKGMLAGGSIPFSKVPRQLIAEANRLGLFVMDNCHYPMGDSYLTLGIGGILRAAEKYENLRAVTDEERERQARMHAIYRVYDGIRSLILRHAQLARSRSEETKDAAGRARLGRLAERLRHISTEPPRDFCEALQLFYFMYTLRGFWGVGCIGRLDQILYPAYERGRASSDAGCQAYDEECLSFILDFYAALNSGYTGDTLRNLMLSGQDENGSDVTNELTWLFLEAYRRRPDAEPHLNVRLHEHSPQKLWELCSRMILEGRGQPTLYFDQNILPAMEQAGIPHSLAVRYANDGCTETVYCGKSGIVFWQHEMVKTVELTIFNGEENPSVYPVRMHKNSTRSPEFEAKTNLVTGFRSGKMEDVGTFEEFLNAFHRQLDFQLDHWFSIIDRRIQEDADGHITSPFTAATFMDCLLTGKDPLRGGGFDVTNYQLLSGTVSTCADCLEGVRYAVFEKKYCSLTELRTAMANDFRGEEVLRQRLLRAPKFGNGEERTDKLAALVSQWFLDRVNGHRGPGNTRIRPGLYNIDFLIFANCTGATPDGRRFRDAIGEHCCPTPGAAKNGPTAIIRSCGQLPMREGYASSVLQLTLDRNAFVMGADGPSIIRKLAEAARQVGIPVFNLAMYDADTLKDAQKHPEKHRDLIVRVWGFNARFIDLDRELQEHIIGRISK